MTINYFFLFSCCCFSVKDRPRSPNWTLDFEPAFSPRFSPTLSPRSIFQTRQRFPISNHVTSGWMSPRSNFDHWSAVSHTGSSYGHVIALDQSEAFITAHTSPLYYSWRLEPLNILNGEGVYYSSPYLRLSVAS